MANETATQCEVCGAAPDGEHVAAVHDQVVEIPHEDVEDRFGLSDLALNAPPEPPSIGEPDILDKLQKRLYESIDDMDSKEALRFYEALVKREESRAKLSAKGKATPETSELRRKAKRAIGGGGSDDDGDE